MSPYRLTTAMSTKEKANVFKFTEASVQKRCLRPQPGEVQQNGRKLREKSYWDTEVKGFGVVAYLKQSTFIIFRNVLGEPAKVRIGHVGVWTVAMARARARELAVDMDRGINPNEVKRLAKARGITVRQALELHAKDMQKRDCAKLSVEFVEKEIPKYLPDWMDRPLVEIGKLDCVQRHARISEKRGKQIANRVFKMLGAAYTGAARIYEHLPDVPPTKAIRWNPTRRRRAPIPWEDLPDWWRRVHALGNPIRRDLQLVMLLTGLRCTDAKTIRWEDVDMLRKTLHRPKPKGGVDRAFTIPLAEFVLGILRRRRRENDVLLPESEWVFPTRLRDGSVSHVAEPKELRSIKTAEGKETKVTVLPSPHRLRDTFLTAAHECYLRELDIKTLANHALPGGDVTQGYIRPDVEHLRACVERVASFLLGKVGEEGYAASTDARP